MNPSLYCRLRCALVLSAVVWPVLGAAPLRADGLKSAQVSRLYNEVKLLPENQPARPASVADVVSGKAAVQTGTGSRAELVFTDKTLTRLGANTFFSFENGTRNLDLGNGTMLLQVPKNAGGAEIHTAAVTAAITGTTLMVEYNPKSYSKIIVLEGTVRAYLKGRIGESVLIHAGEMLITPPFAKKLPDTVHVDLGVLYATSGLLDDRAFGALPSDRLVSNEINRQKGDVAKGKLHSSNLFIAGLGTQVQVGNLSYVGATNTRITAQQGRDSAINLDHPGSGTPKPQLPPVSPTVPPVSPTMPPASPTVPPVSPTVPPVSPTVPPVSPTMPPVSPTVPPVSPTVPPVSPTVPPVSPTVPPVSPTVPPVSPTVPPVSPTVPPVSPTVPPVSPTVPPVSPTVPPVSPTVPPVSPTVPPVSPTVPPVSPTVPPVSPTVPPVSPTVPPVSPTVPPVSPTVPPVSPTIPPVSPTVPPVSPTVPPVSPTVPPVSPTVPPVSPTVPPVSPTVPPVSPTVPPVSPTVPPVSPTVPPVSPTVPPVSPTVPPVSPTPSKTGPLVTIPGNDASSPALYDIDGTTTILTDPYITTQGVTGYGKIYRGSAAGDGAPSSFLLGASTPSNFDTQVGFDTQFDAGAQIGTFLFNSLAFTAAPASISITGGPASLALVAVNTIAANSAAAITIDVSSLAQLLLATQNGSINLSNVTFTDNSSGTSAGTSLTFYARGAANSLNLTSANLAVSGSLSLFGEGGLNFNAGSQALSVNNAILIAGADLNLGGTIQVYNGSAGAINVTANGNLSIATSGVLNTQGPLNLTSGGTFQSDGYTGTSSNTLTIHSTGDLTTTSNAQLSGNTVNLTTSGVLTLGGTTSFATSLNASAVGALNVPGLVSAEGGTATFGTSTGDVSVGGQISANTVNFNVSSGNYSTSTGALISANAINISAPDGNISLSAAVYTGLGGSTVAVTATGNIISIPDATFTTAPNQTFNLTANGTFTVPANAAYTFNSLTLNNPDTAANPGNLVLNADSALTLGFATVGASLSLADGAAFTTGNATVAQTVTLTGAPTLNISGVFEVKNHDGAAAAFTATGAATINLSNPATTGSYGLFLDAGNFNGGSATINGAANSTVSVENGSFTTTGAVTADQFIVGGSVSIGGALQARSVNAAPVAGDTITVGALSAGTLTTSESVIVTGNVTPYNRTAPDTFAPEILGVGGSLNYTGITTGTLPTNINGGQLKLSLRSPFNLGAGALTRSGSTDSYATSANFAGAPLTPTTDNLTAGQGGSLEIDTGSVTNAGDFSAGDFTGSGGATTINLQGGNLMSAGTTGFGGNGGTLLVNSANNININAGVTVNADGGDFINTATVTGMGTPNGGNGGTVTLNALVNQNGAIDFEDSTVIDLHGGAVNAGGASGNAAGNGGTLTLSANGQVALGNGTGTPPLFNAQGGANSQAGTSGNGGSISLSAGGSIMLEPAVQLTADGGLLSGASGTAGHGGAVTLQAAGVITLGFYTDITPEVIKRPIRMPEGSPGDTGTVFLTADGGTANQTGLTGGNGGTINLTSGNTDTTQTSIQTSNVLISATTGGNSMTTFGGTGGTINITASNTTAAAPQDNPPPAQIDLDDTTVVASDDGTVASNTPSSHSQVGGTINVTSMLPSGPGILVTDGSNLVALVNANSTGAGGTIKLLTSGATIEVDSSTLQASGTGSLVELNTQQAPPDSGTTSITLSGATLSADSINVSTAGPNDQINISGGSTLTAGSTLTIYGHGIALGDYGETTNQFLASTTNGTINLTGTTGSFNLIDLNGATLAANTINIQTTGDGSSMYVDGGSTLTAGSTLTINSANIELGDGGETSNQLLANNSGGTISLTAATTTGQGIISLNNCTVQADNITFTVSGPGSEILIENDQSSAATPATFAARSSLTLDGPTIEITNATLTADPAIGVMIFDTTDATQTGTVSLSGATLSANSVQLTARGTGGTVSVDSSSVTGNAFLAIAGANIQVTDVSTLTSDPGAGSITLDTVDTTQTGMITVSSSSLSAASLSLAARGTGGTVNVMAGSMLNGVNSLALQGANITVDDSTLTASGNGSVFTLGGTGGTGSGANILVSSGILEADGTGSKLTLTGAPGTGADITVNGVSDLEANGAGNVLTLTTASTTGTGIMISSGSMLSSTYTANGTVDGGTINLTTAGAAINVDDSTLTASGTASTINLTSTGSAANVTVNDSTLMTAGTGGTISLLSTGTGSTLNVTGGSTVTGDASVSLAGTTITVTSSTVSADSSVGTVTLDTTDATQAGVVNITSATLSAGAVSLTARGTNGAITVGGTGGTGGVQAALTASASTGSLTLQTPGDNGSITINPDSTLTASGTSGTLNLLAPGTTGLITIGTANTSNTDATTLSANLLKMRAMGANGSIVINANSTLSATTQLLLYADGSNGSITFQGGNITLNTGSLAGILAAPSITIKTGTTVKVNGSTPIQVYTNNANYSDDYGGNDTQVGVFAGNAQPSGTPQPFSDAPAYPSTGHARKVAANAAAASAAGSTTPAANLPTSGKGRPAGTANRPTVLPMQRPSLPFSALNLNDLSYDPHLLQGGPKTAAAVPTKRNKAGTRAAGGDGSAGREKVRAAVARPETGSNKPAPALLTSSLRPLH